VAAPVRLLMSPSRLAGSHAPWPDLAVRSSFIAEPVKPQLPVKLYAARRRFLGRMREGLSADVPTLSSESATRSGGHSCGVRRLTIQAPAHCRRRSCEVSWMLCRMPAVDLDGAA
jgi:hypothetical protein